MSYRVVLPSIYPPWTRACLLTCRIPTECMLVIDNSLHNLGVAASWNRGVEHVLSEGLDWLIILSAATRFGAPGGLDFVALLEEQDNAWALEAHPHFGWHLIAFHRRIFEGVGYFDENFWPAYWEDNDFAYRVTLLGDLLEERPLWEKVEVDAYDAGHGHGHRLGKNAVVEPDRLLAYYEGKWGGPPSKERFRRPFDDNDRDLSWWPGQIPERSIR